ncbi:MAG: hypothetical protein IPJ71_09850 [Bdellovibrionales bacterium]|nr:hypothetical protein [Bdellovibrionales bacterium]
MNPDQLKVENLEALVEELLKAAPEEKLVEERMRLTGIPYSTDPIERINLVLRALHFDESDGQSKGEK